MILTILWLIIGLAWLLYETDYMRVRLLTGIEKPVKYAQYKAFNSLTKKKLYWSVPLLHHGSNAEEPEGVMYEVILAPGITEPLCGWNWLDKHCADLVGFEHKVYLAIAGVKYDMTIKSPSILNEVMKVNKLSKKEKLEYA